jgi:hypothetical protein
MHAIAVQGLYVANVKESSAPSETKPEIIVFGTT